MNERTVAVFEDRSQLLPYTSNDRRPFEAMTIERLGRYVGRLVPIGRK